MATGIRYVTHLQIDGASVRVSRTAAGRYAAKLAAHRCSWAGNGETVLKAVEDAISAVRAEKRGAVEGRPSNRYRVAQSLG